jgi:hypothetical protein
MNANVGLSFKKPDQPSVNDDCEMEDQQDEKMDLHMHDKANLSKTNSNVQNLNTQDSTVVESQNRDFIMDISSTNSLASEHMNQDYSNSMA